MGRLPDSRQIFLTTPFVPGGEEFLAMYVFDEDGTLLEARIESFGPRSDFRPGRRRGCRRRWIREVGPVAWGSIEVAPFVVERAGVEFGLIPERDEDGVTVHAMPGDYMAFAPPWDDGRYDT